MFTGWCLTIEKQNEKCPSWCPKMILGHVCEHRIYSPMCYRVVNTVPEIFRVEEIEPVPELEKKYDFMVGRMPRRKKARG